MATKQQQEHVVTPANPLEPLEVNLQCKTCGQAYAVLTGHDARPTNIWAAHRAHCAAVHGWSPNA
jgi:hypothetical protein